MKILVAIKKTLDHRVKVRLNAENTEIDLKNAKLSLCPFDEIALEEAIRLKEKNQASEVTVVTLGDKKDDDILRTAIAMGADKAIHILASHDALSPLYVAKILAAMAQKTGAQLVLCGKQAIDSDSNQVAQMTAAFMNCSQATFASHIEINGENIIVEREVDGGLSRIMLTLPAVISSDLRLNTARLPALPALMKAKRASIETISLNELNIAHESCVKTVKLAMPQMRQGGHILGSVDELMHVLKEKQWL